MLNQFVLLKIIFFFNCNRVIIFIAFNIEIVNPTICSEINFKLSAFFILVKSKWLRQKIWRLTIWHTNTLQLMQFDYRGINLLILVLYIYRH